MTLDGWLHVRLPLHQVAHICCLRHRLTKAFAAKVCCCAVLCCAVRCCAVLCCAVLCCAVLCCAVLCCAVLCCLRQCVVPWAALCCAVLCCAVLCCAVLRCAVLCCAVLCCAVLCCAALRCAALRCGGHNTCTALLDTNDAARLTGPHQQHAAEPALASACAHPELALPVTPLLGQSLLHPDHSYFTCPAICTFSPVWSTCAAQRRNFG